MFFRYVASIVAATFLVAAGCAQGPSADTENRAVGPDGWLKGTTDERLDVVAEQLRGFDMAMVEVGYRFTELFSPERSATGRTPNTMRRRSKRQSGRVWSAGQNERLRPRRF
jgi:hypothetical protein